MKPLFLTLILSIGFAVSTQAQYRVTNEVNDKKITKIGEYLYDVEIYNEKGEILQKGQYWKDGNNLLPHGNWVLYSQSSDDIITTATYEKGQQVYVETNINGTMLRADENLIAIKRLERQIKELEKRLATLRQQ